MRCHHIIDPHIGEMASKVRARRSSDRMSREYGVAGDEWPSSFAGARARNLLIDWKIVTDAIPRDAGWAFALHEGLRLLSPQDGPPEVVFPPTRSGEIRPLERVPDHDSRSDSHPRRSTHVSSAPSGLPKPRTNARAERDLIAVLLLPDDVAFAASVLNIA